MPRRAVPGVPGRPAHPSGTADVRSAGGQVRHQRLQGAGGEGIVGEVNAGPGHYVQATVALGQQVAKFFKEPGIARCGRAENQFGPLGSRKVLENCAQRCDPGAAVMTTTGVPWARSAVRVP